MYFIIECAVIINNNYLPVKHHWKNVLGKYTDIKLGKIKWIK